MIIQPHTTKTGDPQHRASTLKQRGKHQHKRQVEDEVEVGQPQRRGEARYRQMHLAENRELEIGNGARQHDPRRQQAQSIGDQLRQDEGRPPERL